MVHMVQTIHHYHHHYHFFGIKSRFCYGRLAHMLNWMINLTIKMVSYSMHLVGFLLHEFCKFCLVYKNAKNLVTFICFLPFCSPQQTFFNQIPEKFSTDLRSSVNASNNLLSANPTKWSNTLKKFVGNSLSMFDHFVGLALKVHSISSNDNIDMHHRYD